MIRPENWQPADGLTLEPNAFTAATEQQRCQALTAGPGAGKTEMLAQRADFLLRTGVCRYPKRILAISFKVDASRNLKDRVRRRCGTALSARLDSYTFHGFAKRIIDRFRPVLAGRDALDRGYTIGERRVTRQQITFGDLVPLAIEILENSTAALNAVRQTYSDVFLDEFQDCTNEQYSLITLAFHRTAIRLISVGDTKQKIMAWAGALEGIFASFARDFEAVALNLYLNFRSKPKLLRMQNEIIRVLDPASVVPDDQIEGDEGIIDIQAFQNSQEEAEFLAEQIDNWINQGNLPPSEIAVLIPKLADFYAQFLVEELERRGIPFRSEQQLQDLSVEPATRLIVDYLLVLFGDREPDAYTRLMAQLIESIFDEQEQSRLRSDWLRFIRAERAKTRQPENQNFDRKWSFVDSFLEVFGNERVVSLSAEYESAARLQEIVDNTKDHIRGMVESGSDFVNSLKLLTDPQAVRIMSVHKSKGLEFDSVIMLGVEDQTFWGNINDERCVFFVGISRAKNRLLLTCADERPRPEGYTKRWDIARTPHREFLGYALPFVEEE